MAEPVRNDDPLSSMRFPESPAPATSAAGFVPVTTPVEPAGLLPETLPDRPLGAWPPGSRPGDARLEAAGERLGSALGTVVSQSREISGIMQNRMSELKKKFRVIAGRGSAEISAEIKHRASELTDEAQQRASELAAEADREIRFWEFRARLYARRNPFQFIAGAAAAGFVVGFLFHLWRDE